MDVITRTDPAARARRRLRPRDSRRRAGLLRAVLSLLFLFFTAAAGPASASTAPAAPSAEARLLVRDGVPTVVARLLVERQAPDRARLGVLFDLAPGWHVYWRSPGSTGLPPELAFDAPNAEIGPIQWPAPRAFQRDDLPSYGYVGQVLLAADAVFAAKPARATRIAVDGDVLVCESECVPASFRLERRLDASLPDLSRADESRLFERFAARVPEQPGVRGLALEARYSQSAIRPGDAFQAAIGVRSCGSDAPPGCVPLVPRAGTEGGVVFFPDDTPGLELQVVGVATDPADPRTRWVSLAGMADPDEPLEAPRLSGVLALADPAGHAVHVEVRLPLPTAARGAAIETRELPGRDHAARPAAAAGLSLVHALLLALLGGLVLNLMPCVLPVLAIKVFSISEMAHAAHAGRGEPIRHGIAYSTGILGSMAVLGGSVVALRAAGHSVGWGFQFQEPAYVAAIAAVLVAFALNLFGAFEIQVGVGALGSLGQQATGARRSFFEGLLAVALATPCSAPFLGTAIGFAFASEPSVILAIFLAVGVGLAAPFALVTLIPSWGRFVPRSGAWMHSVRAGLGFTLLATVVWLLSVFGASASLSGVIGLCAFLLALAFGLWCFGLIQRSNRPRTTVAAGLFVLALGVAGLNVVSARLVPDTGSGAPGDRAGGSVGPATGEAAAWRPWTPEDVQAALSARSPVFVRFTADWCITCKVNERLVLQDAAVEEALERGGFVRFVGDWTRRDETIRAELARHGRAGVPLYLVYDPARPDAPVLLPELLSVDSTLAALRAVSAGS